MGVSLSSPEGELLSWAPLVGLGYEGDQVAEAGLATALVTLNAREVVSMEEKDIRRDFISSLELTEDSIAGLAAAAPSPGSGMLDAEVVAGLVRRRDLAVTGLRLLGYDGFDDPELLGWYVYDGSMRHRRETVVRQSVIMGLGRSPEQSVGAVEVGALMAAWTRLGEYDSVARDRGVDATLDLFRWAHDARFTGLETRAAILLCVIEATLGRFRGKDDEVSLEALVGALDGVDPAAAAWFSAEGRSFRNSVAHGYWRPRLERAGALERPVEPEPLAFLRAIGRAALSELLRTWTAAAPPTRAARRPRDLVVERLLEVGV